MGLCFGYAGRSRERRAAREPFVLIRALARKAVVSDDERRAGAESHEDLHQGLQALFRRQEVQRQEAGGAIERPHGRAVDIAFMPIRQTSMEASQVDARQTPVGQLHGQFKIELKRLFLEHVKVAYEIACIHYKDDFIDTARADEIRQFLYENSLSDKTETWSIEDVAKRLRIVPQVDESTTNLLIAYLTKNEPHAYHLALVIGSNVVVSMLGMGVVLVDAIDASRASSAFFLNDIRQKKCLIQAL